MDEIIKNFGLNSTFWIQLINFTVLMLMFVKWGLKPVQKVLKERQQFAQKLKDKELALNKRMEQLEQDYKKKLQDADKKATQIIQDAKDYAEELKQQIGEELYEFKKRETKKFQQYLKFKEKDYLSELEQKLINSFDSSLHNILSGNKKLAESFTKALVDKISEELSNDKN